MADTDTLPDELTITLRKPIDFAGSSLTAIVLREPTADEMMQWDSLSGTAADRKAIAIVAGVPEQVVSKMTARDFNKAARFIGSFLA